VFVPVNLTNLTTPATVIIPMGQPDNAGSFKILFKILAGDIRLRRGGAPRRFGARNYGDRGTDADNGREFLMQVTRRRAQPWPEWFTCALVCGVTALPAVVLFWLLVRAGINPVAAHGMVLVATFAANFNLHCRWTWAGSRHTRAQRRGFVAVRFLTVAASWWIFKELLIAGFHHRAANIVALTAGLAANYLLTRLIHDQPVTRQVHDRPAQTRPRLPREDRQITSGSSEPHNRSRLRGSYAGAGR
jgi:putative flippase GtrA